MEMIKKTVIILAALFVLGVFYACAPADNDKTAENKTGGFTNKAPDFTLEKSDGTKVSLSDYAGKPIIINFWSIGCHYCIREFGYFTQAEKDFPDVVFLAVDTWENADLRDMQTKKGIEEFAEKNGLGLTILFDVESRVFEEKYTSAGVPATFLIDNNGEIFYRIPGAVPDYKTLKSVITGFLESQ